MDKVELQRRVDAIQWYHEFDFGDGVRSKAVAPYPELWETSRAFLDRVDFKGKTVLDIGCWDGYWSFYAERRGAARVLATDFNTQRWAELKGEKIRAAGWEENPGFALAREAFQSKVEYRGNISVYDLDQLKEQFDIVLFLGVLYHLTHPMYALTQVRHRVKEGGLLVAESGVLHDETNSYMHYYYGPEGKEPYRKGDPSNWILPTTRCMKDMLRANYLEVLDAATCCLSGDPAKRDAQRDKAERRRLRPAWQTAAPVEEIHARQLVLARAVARRDDNHLYEPQFGLARYDARFQ